ncbi:MAG TPA: Maf family protein [Terriglobales bacterium]|nr:Maf family protein [Terriglobales bacterium]
MIAPPRLVLASASPRRRELLEGAGFAVEVRPAAVDETPLPGEAAADYVLRLARAKARAVEASGLVLGADTVVVVDGDLLGKPADDAEAGAMLARLAGREHQVLTGVCLRDPARGREAAQVETTRVWFAPLSPQEIADYVASGEPRDKAGAYAIQGRAARFIPRIEGSYANVVGLPIATVWELWREIVG